MGSAVGAWVYKKYLDFKKQTHDTAGDFDGQETNLPEPRKGNNTNKVQQDNRNSGSQNQKKSMTAQYNQFQKLRTKIFDKSAKLIDDNRSKKEPLLKSLPDIN